MTTQPLLSAIELRLSLQSASSPIDANVYEIGKGLLGVAILLERCQGDALLEPPERGRFAFQLRILAQEGKQIAGDPGAAARKADFIERVESALDTVIDELEGNRPHHHDAAARGPRVIARSLYPIEIGPSDAWLRSSSSR